MTFSNFKRFQHKPARPFQIYDKTAVFSKFHLFELSTNNVESDLMSPNCYREFEKSHILYNPKEKISIQQYSNHTRLIHLKNPDLRIYPVSITRIKYTDIKLKQFEFDILAKLSVNTTLTLLSRKPIQQLFLNVDIYVTRDIFSDQVYPANYPKFNLSLGNSLIGIGKLTDRRGYATIDPNYFIRNRANSHNYNKNGGFYQEIVRPFANSRIDESNTINFPLGPEISLLN